MNGDFGGKHVRRTVGRQERNTSPAKKFFPLSIKPLHGCNLLYLPNLINPWDLHFFAVNIRSDTHLNTDSILKEGQEEVQNLAKKRL